MMSVTELKYSIFKDIDRIDDENVLAKVAAYIRRKTEALNQPDIPAQFKQNPQKYSPSGDPFYADQRHTDDLDRRMKAISEGNEKPSAVITTPQELNDFLNAL